MTIIQLIKSEIEGLDWKNYKWVVIFAIIVIFPMLGFIPSSYNLYYICMAMAFLFLIKELKSISSLCVCVLVACATSIVTNTIAPIFAPWARFVLFVVVFAVGSPLMQSEKLRFFRLKVLQVIVVMCVLVSLGSFVCYFLGINYMRVVNNDVSYLKYAGLFGGLTRHSMQLGLMGSFATIYTCYKALITKSNLYWVTSVLCVTCTMFAASRAAFLGAIVGILAMLYAFSKTKTQFMRSLMKIIVIGGITLPFWNSALGALEQKNVRNIESGSPIASRGIKWENRIEEFVSSPITGIGFCSVDLKNTEDYNNGGGIETGTSWLSVLSMTGIIGFIPFCMIFYNAIVNVYKRRTRESVLLIGLIACISLHMLAEGYIFSGGSPFCFIAWLVISCSYDNQYRPVTR